MNKKQLLEKLEWLDDEDEIYIAEPTGNYWGHVLAVPVRKLDTETCRESGYNGGPIIVDKWSDEGSDEDTQELWILS